MNFEKNNKLAKIFGWIIIGALIITIILIAYRTNYGNTEYDLGPFSILYAIDFKFTRYVLAALAVLIIPYAVFSRRRAIARKKLI
jgi:hypothetical protein